MHCYLFDIRGDLMLDFDRRLDAPEDPLPAAPSSLHRQKQQRKFYDCLEPKDAGQFRSFCHADHQPHPTADTIPHLLLLPKKAYSAVFLSRYSSQLLKTTDPIPGEAACALGQKTMRQLQARYPNHPLLPALAFLSMEELYHTASPLLALVPDVVRDMLAVLTVGKEPHGHPPLRAYYHELYVTDTPPILDLRTLLPTLHSHTQASPLFAGLTTTLSLPDCDAERTWVRCPITAFLYIYLLLCHTTAALADDGTAAVGLFPCEKGVRLRFSGHRLHPPEPDPLDAFSTANELYTLLHRCPSYGGLLTMAQYFLHRHHIPFTCTLLDNTLSVTLTLEAAAQDTLEFHSGDLSAQLSRALPDAFGLLSSLLT